MTEQAELIAGPEVLYAKIQNCIMQQLVCENQLIFSSEGSYGEFCTHAHV